MVAHEYAHAEAAYRQGDDTAYMLGRLTLNPLKHIDPVMTVLLPIVLWLSHAGFLFGAAKPVPVRSEEHTSELQSRLHLVCRLLLEKKKKKKHNVFIVLMRTHSQ